MATENPEIPRFTIGELLSAEDVNTLADALRRLQDTYARGTSTGKQKWFDLRDRAFIVDHFLAETQEASCSGSPGNPVFTDARYYLQRSIALPELSSGDILDTKPEPVSGWKQCLIGTNLAELPPRGSTAKGSHLLAPKTRVHVWSMYLRCSPQRKVYWFTQPVPRIFTVQEDGSGVAGNQTTPCTFKYNVMRGSTVLASGVSVDSGRIILATYVAATKGDVYIKDDGTVGLWTVNETLHQHNCG